MPVNMSRVKLLLVRISVIVWNNALRGLRACIFSVAEGVAFVAFFNSNRGSPVVAVVVGENVCFAIVIFIVGEAAVRTVIVSRPIV